MINVIKKKFLDRSTRSLLDIGCDLGDLTFEFEKLGFEKIIGIDKDEQIKEKQFPFYLIKKGKAFGKDQIFIPEKNETITLKEFIENKESLFPIEYKYFKEKYEFVIGEKDGDIEHFPLKENSFDVIIAKNIMHFVDEKIEPEVIRKIKQGLRKDGLFYLEVNKLDSPGMKNPKASKIGKYTLVDKDMTPNKFVLYDLERIHKTTSNFKVLKEFSNFDDESTFQLWMTTK